MKTFLIIFTMLIFATGHEAIAFGETTGHFMTPFDSIVAFKTASETFLKKDLEAVTFKPGAKVLGNLESFRVNGQYHLKEDVRFVILKD